MSCEDRIEEYNEEEENENQKGEKRSSNLQDEMSKGQESSANGQGESSTGQEESSEVLKGLSRTQEKRSNKQEEREKGHEKMSKLQNEWSKGREDSSKGQKGLSEEQRQSLNTQEESSRCDELSENYAHQRSDVPKIQKTSKSSKSQTVAKILSFPDQENKEIINQYEHHCKTTHSENVDSDINIQEIPELKQENELSKKHAMIKTASKGNVKSLDFLKIFWTPVTQDETELSVERMKRTRPISRTQWEQFGQQNIPHSQTHSKVTRTFTPLEAKSDKYVKKKRNQSSHTRKSSSHLNVSDSDSSTEDFEFTNDLVRAGKRNINKKKDSLLSSSSYTNDGTDNSKLNTRVSVTLDDIGDDETKISFIIENKVAHSVEDDIMKIENPNNAVQSNDRVHEEQNVEFSIDITVDNKLHADFGQMFTRTKTMSARYDSIDNNRQYEQHGRIIDESRHASSHNKETVAIKREVIITL